MKARCRRLRSNAENSDWGVYQLVMSRGEANTLMLLCDLTDGDPNESRFRHIRNIGNALRRAGAEEIGHRTPTVGHTEFLPQNRR